MVNEIRNIAISILVVSVIMLSGSNIITAFTGKTVTGLPGQNEGQNLASDIEGYVGDFQDTTQTETNIGVGGVVKLIRDVVLGAPKYAITMFSSAASWLGISSTVVTLFYTIVLIIAIFAGILLLRGITK